jgi:hypothetical protein
MDPDDFCAPQPSAAIMGHPPTTNPCPTTGRESIGVPLGMLKETIFLSMTITMGEFCPPQPSRTESWAIRTTITHKKISGRMGQPV